MTLQIRWLIRRDMPEVLTIEEGAFPSPWSEDDFIRALKRRNTIGMVAEEGHRVVGYMIYHLQKPHQRLHLLSLAVHPLHRLAGVGAAMVDKLKSKLSTRSYQAITTDVIEDNVAAQIFLYSCGFRAIDTTGGFWTEAPERQAIHMRYDALPSGGDVWDMVLSEAED